MATSSTASEEKSNQESGKFECNICFEQAEDAVVSMCGHLFCWPCIHRWMESRPNSATCPVCKAVIDKEKLIPLYGRGSGNKDPRDNVPPRPQGQREEAPEEEQGMFGDMGGGINVSFGLGGFPFMGPMFQMGNVPFGQQQFQQRRRPGGAGAMPPNRRQREEQQRVARIFVTLAILVIILIIFS